jgi:hypothetical protein
MTTSPNGEGSDPMTQFPGAFFQDHDAFEQREVKDILEEEAHEGHDDHEHGEGCGHEAIEHGDHVDYVHDGHRHFFKDGLWHHHPTDAG